jgi:hypothetical protein
MDDANDDANDDEAHTRVLTGGQQAKQHTFTLVFTVTVTNGMADATSGLLVTVAAGDTYGGEQFQSHCRRWWFL